MTTPLPADSPTSAPSGPGGARWRRATELAVPLAALAVTVAAPLTVWSRLPDPVAAHWGPGGAPDGALPRLADLLLLALLAAAVGLGPWLAARGRLPRAQARVLIALSWTGSVLLAAVRLATVRANLDAADWRAADALPGTVVLGALALGAVVGSVGALVAGDRPERRPATRPAARVPVEPGETVVWSDTVSGRAGVVLPAVLLLAGAVATWLLPGAARTGALAAAGIAALVLAVLGQARVTVGPRGLRVALGWLGWPRLHVPLDDVDEVAVEDVEPAAYGGWGLRHAPRTTAVVIRRGEGLRVTRRSGRSLVVTVDGAAQAAGVLLAHRAATGGGDVDPDR